MPHAPSAANLNTSMKRAASLPVRPSSISDARYRPPALTARADLLAGVPTAVISEERP